LVFGLCETAAENAKHDKALFIDHACTVCSRTMLAGSLIKLFALTRYTPLVSSVRAMMEWLFVTWMRDCASINTVIAQ